MQCLICLQSSPNQYSLCNCQHKYCLQCCKQHIHSKLDQFVQIKCLNQQCTSQLDTSTLPFLELDSEYQTKYNKYLRYYYFKINLHLRQCRQLNCEGEFDIKRNPSRCILCKTEYCTKCFQPKMNEHICSTQIQSMMNSLHYKKCKKCGIYVEKIQGCNYITCKCGSNFCYSCGAQWSEDPCRLIIFQKKNDQIRILLKELNVQIFKSEENYICNLIKLVLKIIMFPFLIFFGALIIPVIIITFIYAAFTLLIPIGVIILVRQSKNSKSCKNFSTILIILLYPVISILCGVSLVVYLILGLFLRNRFEYHHGIYDVLEEAILSYIIKSLKILVGIMKA